jgi:hypothetical protein
LIAREIRSLPGDSAVSVRWDRGDALREDEHFEELGIYADIRYLSTSQAFLRFSKGGINKYMLNAAGGGGGSTLLFIDWKFNTHGKHTRWGWREN